MRIFSQFHDYYDSIQKYGADENIHYFRNTYLMDNKEIYESISKNFVNKYSLINFPNTEVSYFVIGFCGKLYYCSKISYYVNGEKITKAVYTFDDFKKIYKEIKKHNSFTFKDKKMFIRFEKDISPVIYGTPNLKTIKRTFQNFKNGIAFDEIFHILKQPIFLIEIFTHYCSQIGTIKINPVLQDLEFYKIFNPFETFQEIAMYISGVLGSQENISEISDEEMKIKKGFGHKYAFKKEPKNKS